MKHTAKTSLFFLFFFIKKPKPRSLTGPLEEQISTLLKIYGHSSRLRPLLKNDLDGLEKCAKEK